MTPADIEAIERATLAAVSPQAVEEIPGWLLPFDRGTVGRAKSAVPLAHTGAGAAVLGEIEARYGQRHLPAVLRIPCVPAFEAFCEALERSGYGRHKPTQVFVAATRVVLGASGSVGPVHIADAPDTCWASVFSGEGFDPADGASRVEILSRATGSVFASVREQGRCVAGGAAAFAHGWASVHGMRTAQDCRGRGLAGRILASLARAALERGFERMFLQVESGNAPAHAVYRRAGFESAWRYEYWRKAAPVAP
jgi:N-acetylglutamate synthase